MKFEKQEKTEQSIERARRVRTFIEAAAREMREREGIPLRDDGRIDMTAFRNLYSDEKRDETTVAEWQQGWYPNIPAEKIDEERLKSDGEKLELLKTAIFQKSLGSKFIVARTSLYDDIKNKADNILIDRDTGTTVCAFDEVGAISGLEYESKTSKVLERNTRDGGAVVKYGLSLEDKGSGAKELILGKIEHVPLFYLALSKEFIEQGLTEFLPSGGQSGFEKKLFEYFISVIETQIRGLELREKRLDVLLGERLHAFRDAMKRMRSINIPR